MILLRTETIKKEQNKCILHKKFFCILCSNFFFSTVIYNIVWCPFLGSGIRVQKILLLYTCTHLHPLQFIKEKTKNVLKPHKVTERNFYSKASPPPAQGHVLFLLQKPLARSTDRVRVLKEVPLPDRLGGEKNLRCFSFFFFLFKNVFWDLFFFPIYLKFFFWNFLDFLLDFKPWARPMGSSKSTILGKGNFTVVFRPFSYFVFISFSNLCDSKRNYG